MIAGLERLIGRRVRGVVGLSSRSLALSFEGDPRTFVWIHIERKEAWYALAAELPIAPDPRGSRFIALELPLRGGRVDDAASSGEGGGIVLSVRSRGEGGRLRLALEPDGPRANLSLHREGDGAILWAFHRKPPRKEEPGARPAKPGPEQLPEGSGYRPPVVHSVAAGEERESLRARIDRAFRAEFQSEIDRSLRTAERTLRRRLESAEEDLKRARDMREDRRRAEVLLANFASIPRGASRVGLPDPFADSLRATVEIELDPALSPDENAARLFQRAKRGERGEKLAQARVAETRKLLDDLDERKRHDRLLEPRKALELLGAFLDRARIRKGARGDVRETHLGRQALAAPRAGRPGHRPPGARESVRPRTYVLSDGWQVWVGRSNTDNDLITHRLSNPHDYWFHAVGVPGSHVILRRPTRNSTPKPTTLVEAAQIAAYFSKARKQSRVPVIYTERKFVSKPKRAKPGQALCTRERELLVRPQKPGGAAGDDGINRELSG